MEPCYPENALSLLEGTTSDYSWIISIFRIFGCMVFMVVAVLWLADNLIGDVESVTTSTTEDNKEDSNKSHDSINQSAGSSSMLVRTSKNFKRPNFAPPPPPLCHGLEEGDMRCSCQTTGRSRPESWGGKEREREAVKGKTNSPSVFYYLGKLVQVVGSNNVQVGDENVMQISEEQEQEIPSVSESPCIHCQRHSTRERATSTCDTGVHNPDDVISDVTYTTNQSQETSEEEASPAEPASPSDPDKKKQLFIDARIRIFRAAEELRNPGISVVAKDKSQSKEKATLKEKSSNLEQKEKEHPLRKSWSKLNFPGKKQSKKQLSTFYT